MKAVFIAPDEVAAITIHSLLKEEGFQAIIRSYQIPMVPGVSSTVKPGWGEVLVLEEDYAETKKIVDTYLESLEEKGGGDQERCQV